MPWGPPIPVTAARFGPTRARAERPRRGADARVGRVRTWVNGELLTDPRAPVVTATDHGLTVGDGVFEVIKAVAGRPFALDLHLERMARSAAGLGLPAVDVDAVRRGVTEVLAAEQLPLARVRATWTAGPAPLGSGRGA